VVTQAFGHFHRTRARVRRHSKVTYSLPTKSNVGSKMHHHYGAATRSTVVAAHARPASAVNPALTARRHGSRRGHRDSPIPSLDNRPTAREVDLGCEPPIRIVGSACPADNARHDHTRCTQFAACRSGQRRRRGSGRQIALDRLVSRRTKERTEMSRVWTIASPDLVASSDLY
jgi:hypothetical protein